MKKNPILRLILRDATFSLPKLALVMAVAGLANMLVLAIVNRVAQLVSRGGSEVSERHSGSIGWVTGVDDWLSGIDEASSGVGISDFLIFLAVVLVYFYSQRYALLTACQAVEDAVRRIRVRLGRKIAACELAAFEKVGRGTIYSCLSRDTEVISELTAQLVYGAQMGALVLFVGVYLAFVSTIAFWLMVVFVLVMGFTIVTLRKKLDKNLTAAAASGNLLLESITHILGGFKEVKLNSQRRDHVFRVMDSVSYDVRESKVGSRSIITDWVVFNQLSFYLLLCVIIFIVPKLSSSFGLDIVQVATATLFMTPILGFVSTISLFEVVNRAAESIVRLEQILDDNTSANTKKAEDARWTLESFGVHDLGFDYLDDAGASLFSLGPLRFEVKAGETVFFVGGNGSGKSTLLKLLTSLYEPRFGLLQVNAAALSAEGRQGFREQIGAVFSDHHLFDRLYGLEHVDDARANEMIDFLGLGGKTKVVDGKFETLDLSGGQRKRLGLLVALLEDRPILVLDEVAADQDPEFRRRFYEEFVPELQHSGKTLLLASHDDRYFDVADIRVVLDEGKIRQIVDQRKKT